MLVALALAACTDTAGTASPTRSVASTPSHSAPPSATAPTPVLGQPWGTLEQGDDDHLGTVAATEIFDTDPNWTRDVRWESWGGPQAVGHGVARYIPPGGVAFANGRDEPVTVIAFEPGRCDGVYMYQAITWVFPQEHQTFDRRRYIDLCQRRRVDTEPQPTATNTIPLLGQIWGPYQLGYEEVSPNEVYNGGDPTGRVTDITWKSWGEAEAYGTGTGYDVSWQGDTERGYWEPVTLVAFDLGVCGHTLMYRAIEWTDGHGDNFDPRHYIDICVGGYVDGFEPAGYR